MEKIVTKNQNNWAEMVWEHTIVYRTWKLYTLQKEIIDEAVLCACICSDPFDEHRAFADQSFNRKIIKYLQTEKLRAPSVVENIIHRLLIKYKRKAWAKYDNLPWHNEQRKAIVYRTDQKMTFDCSLN